MTEINVTPNELLYLSYCTSLNCCYGLSDISRQEDVLADLLTKKYLSIYEKGAFHLQSDLETALTFIHLSLRSICIKFMIENKELRILLHVAEQGCVIGYYTQKDNNVRMVITKRSNLMILLILCSFAICGKSENNEKVSFAIDEIREMQKKNQTDSIYAELVNNSDYLSVESIERNLSRSKECHIFKQSEKGVWKVYEKEKKIFFEGYTFEKCYSLLSSIFTRKGIDI